jgi:hypothetical protein
MAGQQHLGVVGVAVGAFVKHSSEICVGRSAQDPRDLTAQLVDVERRQANLDEPVVAPPVSQPVRERNCRHLVVPVGTNERQVLAIHRAAQVRQEF